MKKEHRSLLIMSMVSGLAMLLVAALWAGGESCIDCDGARPASCYSSLQVHNFTLENGTTFKAPKSCYTSVVDIEGLEGSMERPDILRKTSEGLVLNSTGEKINLER